MEIVKYVLTYRSLNIIIYIKLLRIEDVLTRTLEAPHLVYRITSPLTESVMDVWTRYWGFFH